MIVFVKAFLKKTAIAWIAILSTLSPTAFSQEPFIGEMRWFAGNFAPRGWTFCSGQLLAISQNQALFSILGTTYGGDGETSFALPDMRGRSPLHVGGSSGQGPGLSTRSLGQKVGTETNSNQLVAHSHSLHASSNDANSTSPANRVLAAANIYQDSAPNVVMNAESISSTGDGGAPTVNNMHPFTGVNCIIALVGLFPSEN